MAALRDAMAILTTAHCQGSHLALLFDYDGTLTPIVEHPARARLDPATRRLLHRLAEHPNVTVGILSGRCLADLHRMVGLPGVCYAGTSGLEMDLRSERHIHPEAESYRGVLQAAFYRLRALAAAYPGAWVEEKRLGLTLHYRQVEPCLCEDLRVRSHKEMTRYAHWLRTVPGPMAWEITPTVNWDKGCALRQIVESVGRPTLPLYAGDSSNDQPALAAVIELGGVALGVGEGAPPNAQHRIHDPAALLNFLTCLAETLGERVALTVA